LKLAGFQLDKEHLLNLRKQPHGRVFRLRIFEKKGEDMKEKDQADQLHNMQQGQQPYNPANEDQNTSSVKGMNREAEDELLTTGGPVNRSAVEEKGDHGVVNAHTGGMSMEDEEANTSKNDFPGAANRSSGSFSSKPECELDEEEHDYSQDKTEGITNPRTTISEWAKWKTDLKAGRNKGEGNTESGAEEFNDIAPV
jgi:hypothetical protein